MAKRIGTVAGRPAYVTAECRQVAGSGSGPNTAGRFFAKRIGTIAGRPAYVRVCCPLGPPGILTECCPGVEIPEDLTVTYTLLSGDCTCIDGLAYRLTYVDGSSPKKWSRLANVGPIVCGSSLADTNLVTTELTCLATTFWTFGWTQTGSCQFTGGGAVTVSCGPPFSFQQDFTFGGGFGCGCSASTVRVTVVPA
jgi:hypothetical protein